MTDDIDEFEKFGDQASAAKGWSDLNKLRGEYFNKLAKTQSTPSGFDERWLNAKANELYSICLDADFDVDLIERFENWIEALVKTCSAKKTEPTESPQSVPAPTLMSWKEYEQLHQHPTPPTFAFGRTCDWLKPRPKKSEPVTDNDIRQALDSTKADKLIDEPHTTDTRDDNEK